jgi:hypothetical protein
VCSEVYSDGARKSIRNRTKIEPLTNTAPKGPQHAHESSRRCCVNASRYCSRVSILNIGRYIAMMITPTIAPTAIIISGSMIEVSDWIEESTSSS